MLVAFYIIGIRQGYSDRSAWLVAFLFALGTIAWSYSRLLFREPLMAFFTLWSFYFATQLRKNWEEEGVNWHLIIQLLITTVAMLLTKVIAIIFFPPLIIVLMPSLKFLRERFRQIAIPLMVLIAFIVAVFIILDRTNLGINRYSFNHYWATYKDHLEWESIIESFLGYLVSPGRSVWLYNPILILAFPGGWLLIKRGQWRLVSAAALSFAIISFVYGVTLDTEWWGGWGWGPRYVLPLIPVLMLLVLPVFDEFQSLFQKAFIALVSIMSIAVQFIGIAVPVENYFTDRFFSGHVFFGKPDSWMAINWQWKWSPIPYHIEHFNFNHLDVAWRFADQPWLTIILLMFLAALHGVFFWYLVTRQKMIRRSLIAGILMISIGCLVLAISLGMRALRYDERYVQNRDDVMTLLYQLDEAAEPSDAIFLDRAEYTLTFMNYFKTPALFVTLPYVPGEVYGPEGAAVDSDDLGELLGPNTQYPLDWTADRHDRIWLIASSGPFNPEKRRPIEHYLVEHYFPIESIEISQQARAISFLTVDSKSGQPEHVVDFLFGDELKLQGYDLPSDNVFEAGDVVPLSLLWEPQIPLPFDYNTGIYLLTQDQVFVASRDGIPQATFGKTSQWVVGESYWDNYGFQLPANLPSGEYVIAVGVYYWQTPDQRLLVSDGIADPIGDFAPLIHITVK